MGRQHSGALLSGNKASGVGRTLQPGQWLHYHCTFAPPPGEGGRVLLHFGAVDDACAVQVNGHLVGGHRGGYWPFTLDVTAQLNDTGRNSLWVAVQDPTDSGTQARGKQTLKPGGMFYPAQSGIWQTVWLERVPENYIQSAHGHAGLRCPHRDRESPYFHARRCSGTCGPWCGPGA